jgi:CubicO group peptidase (beta-lactamase class C family)
MKRQRRHRLFFVKTKLTLYAVSYLWLTTASQMPLLAQDEEPDTPTQNTLSANPKGNFELPLPITGRADPAMSQIDQAVITFMSEKAIPGAALAITRSGKLVYAKGFGYGDLENKEAVQPDSLFRIAGISKSITQATVLQLIQRGHLGLSDKVFQFLKLKPLVEAGKEIDSRIYEITIADLLDHRSGWDRKAEHCDPMYEEAKIARVYGLKAPPAGEQIINYALGQPLSHEPGTTYAYSNLGYCVLGRVVEELTHQPYEKYVRQNILSPIGIVDMHIARTQASGRDGREVKYYTADGEQEPSVLPSDQGKLVPVQYGAWSLETMDANDGWIASAIDMVRFVSAFEYSEHFAALKGEVMRSRFHAGYSQAGFLPGSAGIVVISRKFPDTCWALLLNSSCARPSELNERLAKTLERMPSWPEYDLFDQYLRGPN